VLLATRVLTKENHALLPYAVAEQLRAEGPHVPASGGWERSHSITLRVRSRNETAVRRGQCFTMDFRSSG
jgi:hypothetical protein